MDDIALLNSVADIQLDGDAIADDTRAARELHHVTDDLRGIGHRGLRVLNVACER